MILIIAHQKSRAYDQQNGACGQFCVWAAISQKVSIIVFVI